MKLAWLLPTLCALPLSAAPGPWISLFNGRDLSGWEVHGGGATYEVIDDAIVGRNGPGHNTFLCTAREYADFELEFEVRLSDALNSGVQIRSHARPEKIGDRMAERVYGPQIEIELSPGESGYVYGERAGGWLTPADQLVAHERFVTGEWNRYRIVAQGPRIRVWINDDLVSDLTHPGIYENHARGFIGLQVHQIEAEPGTLAVAWRNLRLRALSEHSTE